MSPNRSEQHARKRSKRASADTAAPHRAAKHEVFRYTQPKIQLPHFSPPLQQLQQQQRRSISSFGRRIVVEPPPAEEEEEVDLQSGTSEPPLKAQTETDIASAPASAPLPTSTSTPPFATSTTALQPPSHLSPGESTLYTLLASALDPSALSVQDISGGCGSMYAITVASGHFKGKSVVKQHRMVNEVLRAEDCGPARVAGPDLRWGEDGSP